ncbi:MAG: glycosyltransferase family 2 protein [Planctomycetota bacterium]
MTSGPNRCTAVVVHYRGARDTILCVRSLLDHAPGVAILVVDNASPDGSGARVAREFEREPLVSIVRSPANGGFGAGANLGIERALAATRDLFAVLLLNPDARVLPGAVENMLDVAKRHERAGIVGCRIRRADARGDWFQNGRFPRFSLSRFHCQPPRGRIEFQAEFVSGCAMLLMADLLRAGLRFHEPFFLYGEDADLCRQVVARGREIWVTLRAVVTHEGGGSQRGEEVLPDTTAAQLYWQTRAKVLLAARQLRPLQRATFLFAAAVLKPLAGVLLFRRISFLRPYFSGLRAGLGERSRPSPGPGPGVRLPR